MVPKPGLKQSPRKIRQPNRPVHSWEERLERMTAEEQRTQALELPEVLTGYAGLQSTMRQVCHFNPAFCLKKGKDN